MPHPVTARTGLWKLAFPPNSINVNHCNTFVLAITLNLSSVPQALQTSNSTIPAWSEQSSHSERTFKLFCKQAMRSVLLSSEGMPKPFALFIDSSYGLRAIFSHLGVILQYFALQIEDKKVCHLAANHGLESSYLQ